MWQIINTPETLIFGVALAMMLLLGLVECALWMMGASSDWLNSFLPDSLGELGDVHSPDVAMDLDSAGTFLRFLSWLYLGRLPVLIWLVVFLSVFGTLGYGVQAALYGILGYALPMWLAAIGVWLLSLPIVRTLAAGLYRWLPKDETSAQRSADLVGRVGIIVLGNADAEHAAQVRVKDAFGQTHYVMACADGGAVLTQGSHVLLVAERQGRFLMIANSNPHLQEDES